VYNSDYGGALMDLIIRKARLRHREELVDLAVEGGRIAAMEKSVGARAAAEIDAGGNLVTPPFCDPHLHLDAVLSVGDPRYNRSGTLLEGIAIWGERKPKLTKELIKRNALEAVKWELAQGCLEIRTHADVFASDLIAVQALLELKSDLEDVVDIQVVADAEGRLLAAKAEITRDGGAYASLSLDVLENCLVFGCGPYHVPDVKMVGRVWYTNNVPSGAMRGFGVMQVAFAFESCLDEIARRLGIDLFKIRERNALSAGMPTIADHVLEEGVPGIKETIRAAEKAFRSLEIPAARAGKRIGVGVASAVKNIGFGHGAEESAGTIVELDAQGDLEILVSQHEYGQGSRAGLARLAVETLRVPADRIEISWTDTACTPPTGPTTASRQTFMTGNLASAGRGTEPLGPERLQQPPGPLVLHIRHPRRRC